MMETEQCAVPWSWTGHDGSTKRSKKLICGLPVSHMGKHRVQATSHVTVSWPPFHVGGK